MSEGDQRYRAPALEKGLDILELLANADAPMSMTSMVGHLRRSQGELFRMVQVLQFRGFIEQVANSDGYALTDRLFSLGMSRPQTLGVVELGLPVMRKLAIDSGQSCHLAFHTAGDMVVVARMESAEQLGFSVRVGYRRPLMQAASGAVLYAFQTAEVRAQWEAAMSPAPKRDALKVFRARCDRIAATGFESVASSYVAGVTDISAPVLRGKAAAAAMTMPFIERLDPIVDQQAATALLVAAADCLSALLVAADSRP